MAESASTFSIIIPVYNRAATVMPTLKSCLDQTFQDFEVIVVDDGSTDNLRSVIEGLGDPRFRYIWRENGGANAARNTGIDAARGKYVAFLDSDDLFLPNKLERFAEMMNNDPFRAGYSRVVIDFGGGRTTIEPGRPIGGDEDIGEYMFVCNGLIQNSAIVVHRETAALVRFDAEVKVLDDPAFCLRLDKAGVRFFMVEEPLTIWTDMTDVDRRSRESRYDDLRDWLERLRPMLSRKAVFGYRAIVLAPRLAGSKPLAALKDIALGYFVAGVPGPVTLRFIVRAFIPTAARRQLAYAYRGALRLIRRRTAHAHTDRWR